MDVNPDGLHTRYLEMSDDALIDVAKQYDSLTDDAQTALRAEFARRGMEPPLVDEEVAVEHRKLVTVNRYRDLSEAIVARSMLEAAGIRAYLPDENVLRMQWAWSNFMGGIRLQVGDGDEAAAAEILNESIPENFVLEDGTEFEQPKCPVCGSSEITFQGAGREAAIISMAVIGIPLPPGRESWMCDTCGTHWEDTAEQEPR